MMATKHAFTSAKADGGDATLVKPSDWNADHIGSDILDRNLTQAEVVNTSVETSVYSKSIAAGLLGTDGGFRLYIAGDLLVNAVGNMTLRVKLGATTVFATQAHDMVDDANRRKWVMVVEMLNSAANAQKWSAFFLSSIAAAANFPLWSEGNSLADQAIGSSSSAVDTALAQVLDVTVQWSASSTSLSFRKQLALLELLPKS